MKNSLLVRLAVLALTISMMSGCSWSLGGKKGEPGPPGPSGATGASGATGSTGVPGAPADKN